MDIADKAEDWFFLGEQGPQSGPHLRDELMRRWREGQLTGETLVWTPGMEQWAAFKSVFPNLTPPLPPQRNSRAPTQARDPDTSPSPQVKSKKPKKNWFVFAGIVFLSVILRFSVDNIYRYDFAFSPAMLSVAEFSETFAFALIPLLIAAIVLYRVGHVAAALTAFLIIGSLSLMQVHGDTKLSTGTASTRTFALTEPSPAPATTALPGSQPAIDQYATRIACVDPEGSVVRIRLAQRANNGLELNCIEGDFLKGSSGCTPTNAFPLDAPTDAAITEYIDRLSSARQNTGIAIKGSDMGTHIDFSSNNLSGDGSPPVLNWYFGVNRTTGVGRLMAPDGNADYLCRGG